MNYWQGKRMRLRAIEPSDASVFNFQKEGCLRRMVFTQGGYVDNLLYGMTVKEFEELQKKPENPHG